MAAPTPVKSDTLVKMLPIITAVAAVAYAVAAYFLLLMPKIGPLLQGGELDLAAYAQRAADDEAYLKELQGTVKAYDNWNPEQKQRLSNIVAADPAVPDLFVQVDAIARAHDLVLASIDAIPDEKNVTPAGRRSVRIAANVVGGTYEQFKLFLADIERSDRLLDVQAVVFTPTSASYGLVMRAYYLDARVLQPQAAPAPTVAPGAQGTP